MNSPNPKSPSTSYFSSKLLEPISLFNDSDEDIVAMGKQFAEAIGKLSGGEFVPEKKTYPPFKKVFWEEPRYNPALETIGQSHAVEAHEIESKQHWSKAGRPWGKQVRFKDIPTSNERGPRKPEQFEKCFESPEKYWGRKREIRPFNRARLFAKPIDRCDISFVEDKKHASSLVNPMSYSKPDLWKESPSQILEDYHRPTSNLGSRSKKDLYQFFGIKEENSTRSRSPTHRSKIRPLFGGYIEPLEETVYLSSRSSPRKSPSKELLRSQSSNIPGITIPKAENTSGSFSPTREQGPYVKKVQQDGTYVISPMSKNGKDQNKLNEDEAGSIVNSWARPLTSKETSQLYVESTPIRPIDQLPEAGNQHAHFDDSNVTDSRMLLQDNKTLSKKNSEKALTQKATIPVRPTTASDGPRYIHPTPSRRSTSYENQLLQRKFNIANEIKSSGVIKADTVPLCISEKVPITPKTDMESIKSISNLFDTY